MRATHIERDSCASSTPLCRGARVVRDHGNAQLIDEWYVIDKRIFPSLLLAISMGATALRLLCFFTHILLALPQCYAPEVQQGP